MRFNRQKRHRKTVQFYTVRCGFREPFKVLCDGTFIHHLIVNRLTPADKVLTNLLGCRVKIFTTRCVVAELKRLGDSAKKNEQEKSHSHSYYESLDAARKLSTARCDHEKVKSAMDCIMETIGNNNAEHFFIATQDAELRNNFRKVPGVPLIFGLRNALFIEQPSKFQREFAKSKEEERLHMTHREYRMLDSRVRSRVLSAREETDAHGADEDLGDQRDQILGTRAATRTNTSRKGAVVKDRPQFKRKKPKGPNPLSCKKKKSQPNLAPEKEGKDGDKTSRNRKRKRSRKGKMATDTDG